MCYSKRCNSNTAKTLPVLRERGHKGYADVALAARAARSSIHHCTFDRRVVRAESCKSWHEDLRTPLLLVVRPLRLHLTPEYEHERHTQLLLTRFASMRARCYCYCCDDQTRASISWPSHDLCYNRPAGRNTPRFKRMSWQTQQE